MYSSIVILRLKLHTDLQHNVIVTQVQLQKEREGLFEHVIGDSLYSYILQPQPHTG